MKILNILSDQACLIQMFNPELLFAYCYLATFDFVLVIESQIA